MAPPEKFGGMGRMVAGKIRPKRAMVLVHPSDAERVLDGGKADRFWSFVPDPGPDATTRFVMLW